MLLATLLVANDSNVELLGLTTEEGAFITDATITCVITDPLANVVATISLTYRGAAVAVTVGGKTYLDGNYRGTLAAGNSPALVAGTQYTLTFSASNYGLKRIGYATAQSPTS